MNDVNNRIFREFTEFFDNVEKSASEISVTTAYEITMKSTIVSALINIGHRKAAGRAFLEPSPGAAEYSGFPLYPVAG